MDKLKEAESQYASYKKGYDDGQNDLKEIVLNVIASHKDDDSKEIIAGIVLMCTDGKVPK